MTDPKETGDLILKRLRTLVRVTLALWLCLAVVAGGLAFVARHNYTEGTEVRSALCALRSNLENQVENSREFLLVNPRGIPGIPASTLRASAANQEQAIVALSTLSC